MLHNVQFITSPISGGLLLDKNPGATLAVSLRKLKSNYNGDCIRVRRSSDNAEQDIGFVSNSIDTASMLSFCGAGNGFITTWYDQSGTSNDFSQPTATDQPQIVSSGSVILTNGLPTIDFGDKLSTYFLLLGTGYLNLSTEISLFGVWDITTVAGSNAGVFGPNGTNLKGLEILQVSVINYHSYLRINSFQRDANTGAAYRMWDSAQSLTTIIGDATDLNVFKNSSAVTLTNSNALPALNHNGTYVLGTYAGSGNYMDGNIQEFIIYEASKDSSRTGIETNINDHYAIY